MSKLKIALQIPFSVLVKRLVNKLLPSKKINYLIQDFRDNVLTLEINSLLKDILIFNENTNISHYLKHEFNLLGSGWLKRPLTKALKVYHTHKENTNKILNYLPKEYGLINWQLDVKSGFEFDVSKQFNNQKIDKTKNVDIKNCWELGRLQHLPQMALNTSKNENKTTLIKEFKNQCLDFIASNPIGMGVQWACSMDVGIRVSNILIAYDIFKNIDDNNILSDDFIKILTNSIYQHGLFIYNHLEHKEGAAGNHYLFNLVGLLFVTNYLSENEKTKLWQNFATFELEKEFEKQFFKDGGNFEGSTTYHCLSAEAVLYATALMLRNGNKLSSNYINLLLNAGNFIKSTMKPNGKIPQFGDNDSGRFFKLNNEENNLLNYESLLAGFSGLFKNEFDKFGEKYPLNKSIVEQLSKNKKLQTSKLLPADRHGKPLPITIGTSNLKHTKTTTINFSIKLNLGNVKSYIYPNFGLYIFKSEQFYLSISAICNPKMHHSWGHVHNDKLSFDLQVGGIDLVKDPGTYTYSAFPKLRNELRSVKAHSGIVVADIEQNKMIDLFYLDKEVKCNLLQIYATSITLKAKYYGVEHIRKFEIFEDKLIITDYCNKPFKVNFNQYDKFSPNYGIIENLNE